MYTIEVRKPGRKYKIVSRESDINSARWSFQQHLVPYGRDSVRVRNEATGEVEVTALPKR